MVEILKSLSQKSLEEFTKEELVSELDELKTVLGSLKSEDSKNEVNELISKITSLLEVKKED